MIGSLPSNAEARQKVIDFWDWRGEMASPGCGCLCWLVRDAPKAPGQKFTPDRRGWLMATPSKVRHPPATAESAKPGIAAVKVRGYRRPRPSRSKFPEHPFRRGAGVSVDDRSFEEPRVFRNFFSPQGPASIWGNKSGNNQADVSTSTQLRIT